jgi:hypothetical protein
MPNPRQTRTNAADSAPGVDDGPAGAARHGASRSAQPGRAIVWVLVALSLLALLAIFIMRPMNSGEAPEAQAPAQSAPINPAAPPGPG